MQSLIKQFLIVVLLVLAIFSVTDYVQAADDPPTQETTTDQPSDSAQTAAPAETQTEVTSQETIKEEREPKSLGHKILFYIPNRIVDVLDVFRLRLRVGPGISLSARATNPLSANFGTYTSIYAGLPGPRLKPTLKSPIGFENYAGLQVSVADASTSDASTGPGYSNTEIGAGFQFLLAGIDLGVDPLEAVDFVTGLLFIQIRDDDF